MGCVHPKTSSEEGDTEESENLLRANNSDEERPYVIQPLPPSPVGDHPSIALPNDPGRTVAPLITGESPRPIEPRSNDPQWRDPRWGGNLSGSPRQSSLPTSTRLQEFTDTLPSSTGHIGGDYLQRTNSLSRSPGTGQDETDSIPGEECIQTGRGTELLANLKLGYTWRDQFSLPSQEFLSLMDRLYMECQLHLTALSSRGDIDSRREADAIVNEMIILRNHWGPQLLPNSVCNAFVRERIPLTLGINQRQFRIDCAQFFEPVAFYGPQQNNPGELMKLYRFSVYDVSKNEVVLRYYLERSNVIQLYHVLCFTCENFRGQVHPYGSENPSYWEVRRHMLEDVYSRLLSALSRGTHPAPQAHASTIFPTDQQGPVIIQVSSPVHSNSAQH